MPTFLSDEQLDALVKACQITWFKPSCLDADPDFDDGDEEGLFQAYDNLSVRLSFSNFAFSDFAVSRRFTICYDQTDDIVMAYADDEWPWDAHDELTVKQKQILTAVLDARPELFNCPLPFLRDLIPLLT